MHKVWRGIVFLFLLCFPLSGSSPAQEWKRIEWRFDRDLGITQNLRLTGLTPSTTLFVPVLPGIDWTQSALNLTVWFSDALHPESTLAVFMNDDLLFSQTLQNLPLRPGQPGNLRIPLDLLISSPGERWIKVDIRPTLFISRNPCEDLASGNLWMMIMKKSHFMFNGAIRDLPVSIDEFLLFPTTELEIILPGGEWDREIATAYIKLMSFLKRPENIQAREITTLLFDEMTPEEREDRLKRRIYLRSPSMRDYHLLGNRLYLTPEGVKGLLSPYRVAMTGRSGTVVLEMEDISKYHPQLTFRDLGAGDLYFRGIGDLSAQLHFPASDLGGIPESLFLHLFKNVQKPLAAFGGNGFLKIWFNNQLVLTERLSDAPSGPLSQRIVELPAHLIQRENTLELMFSYFPGKENCMVGAIPLEAFLSGDSFLEYRGITLLPDPLTMMDVPTVFWGKGHIVLPEQFTVKDLKAAALLISTFRELDNTPILIKIHESAEGMDLFLAQEHWLARFGHLPFLDRPSFRPLWQDLARIPSRVREEISGAENGLAEWRTWLTVSLTEYGKGLFRILRFPCDLLFPKMEAIPMPEYFLFIRPDLSRFPEAIPVLPTDDSLTFFSQPESQPSFRVTPDEPLAIMAVKRQGDKPAVFLTTLGREDLAMEYFFRHFRGPETLRSLTGNVILLSQEGWSDLTIDADTRWRPVPVLSWFNWHQKIRIPISIILLMALLIFCLYLYFRLTPPGKR
ncbi:MAG TPA: cellulose biosynthesis cyclic di-GMP-binding regulatory protein BcsB [Atribacteraceae bacterium]|nr:cellulose biosynthesis cyclic di-GMP-binding regulatory protein BcsB [Atribacteraceae bacterium]